MKKVVAVVAAVGTLLVAAPALASTQSIAPNGCPRSAGSLQEFAGCLAQARGTVGAVYRGTQAAYLDDDHRELLGAMQANPGIPPQVVMPYPMYGGYPGVSYPNPYYSTMVRAAGFATAVQNGNMSAMWYMGMPMY